MGTTSKQRELLALAGFVRVDGLYQRDWEHKYGRTIEVFPERQASWAGRYWLGPDLRVIITENCEEIWMGAGVLPPFKGPLVATLFSELCPNGEGDAGYHPANAHFQISLEDILSRLADPDWQPPKK